MARWDNTLIIKKARGLRGVANPLRKKRKGKKRGKREGGRGGRDGQRMELCVGGVAWFGSQVVMKNTTLEIENENHPSAVKVLVWMLFVSASFPLCV